MDNDLIRRSALLEKMKALDIWHETEYQEGYFDGFNDGIAEVEEAPAVDAVEVVRCGKCRHYNLQITSAGTETMCCTISADYDPDVGVWYGFTSYPPPDFYCADGERRTE